MTAASSRSAPLAPVGPVVAVIAVLSWVLALVRPWGDVGVDDGALVTGRPVLLLVLLGAGAVAALAAALAAARWNRTAANRWAAVAGAFVAVVGAVLTVVAWRTAAAQVLPRDGGWWGLLTALAVTVSGVVVAVSGVVRPAGRVSGLATLAVAVVVPVALVVSGVVVAPGWSTRQITGDHPDSFSESPGPATLVHVAWKKTASDDLVAVLGGRVIVARDTTNSSGCELEVRALEAGTGSQQWSLRRPLRCDGPRLAVLDGNNSTVRLTLRGTAGGKPLTGPPLSLYLGLEDGRPFTPSSALDRVQAWTEGFGLVQTDTELRGLDSRTGVTLWSRPLPRCGDHVVTTGVPAAPAPGTRATRTPYDGGAPNGTVPVLSAGNDVVVGTICRDDTGNGAVRGVWMIDVVNGIKADRTVDLPTPAALTAGTDEPGTAVPAATTFLAWLDTVVAVVPVAAPNAFGGLRAGLVGIDRPTGRAVWTRPAAAIRTVDVSPTDGYVSVSQTVAQVPDSNLFGETVVLEARTGTMLAEREEKSPVYASVALTGGRAEFTANSAVVVRNTLTGVGGDTFPTPDCEAEVGKGNAPVLGGPGGVVMRCQPDTYAKIAFIGLVAQR